MRGLFVHLAGFSGACGPWLQFKVPLLIRFDSRSGPFGGLVLFELRVVSE
jgi:hypothetical protein